MKPFETGAGDDAERLQHASGDPRSLGLIRPNRLTMPAAPMVAAEAEGVSLTLDGVKAAFATMRDFDVALVEGAGGLLVPISGNCSMASLAAMLDLPLLIVARPSLGTINHTLLTIEAARQRGLSIVGVVFSEATDARSRGPEEARTPSLIGELGGVRIWGTLPYISASSAAASRPDGELGELVAHLATF